MARAWQYELLPRQPSVRLPLMPSAAQRPKNYPRRESRGMRLKLGSRVADTSDWVDNYLHPLLSASSRLLHQALRDKPMSADDESSDRDPSRGCVAFLSVAALFTAVQRKRSLAGERSVDAGDAKSTFQSAAEGMPVDAAGEPPKPARPPASVAQCSPQNS